MKSFQIIFTFLLATFNLLFFALFFDFQLDVVKLIMSEVSIIITGLLVVYIANKKIHEAFRLSMVYVLPFLGTFQLITSYFIINQLKFNISLLVWVFILFVQIIVLAASTFIKPRPD